MSRQELLVRELMSPMVLSVRQSEDLARVAHLMWEERIRHVPVVDLRGVLVGLISQRDLLRAQLIEQNDQPPAIERAVLESLSAEDLMNTHLEVIEPNAPLKEAARTMYEHKIGCLPVLEREKLVGILTEADFVRYFLDGKQRSIANEEGLNP